MSQVIDIAHVGWKPENDPWKPRFIGNPNGNGNLGDARFSSGFLETSAETKPIEGFHVSTFSSLREGGMETWVDIFARFESGALKYVGSKHRGERFHGESR